MDRNSVSYVCSAPEYDEQTIEERPRQHRLLILGLCLSYFLAALDATIIIPAIGVMGKDLGAPEKIVWVSTAYLVTFNALQPLFGQLSAMMGYGWLFLLSNVTFLVGSIACGVSTNLEGMIISRLVQGMGGGGIIAMSVTTITDLFPLNERSKYLSLLWANLGVATVAGPMIGGQFTDHLSWRWCFFINIPIGGVALLLIYNQISRFPIPKTSFQWHYLGQLDYPGLLCFMLFMISLLAALSLGGIDYAWNSSVVMGCFIGAIVGLLMFIKVELNTKNPLISFAYFKNKEMSLMLLSLFFQGGVFYPTVFNATLFGEFVKGFTATQSGLYLIPLLSGLVLFSIIGTVTLPRFNHRYIPFVSSGTAMCIMGLILIAGLTYDSNWGMMIFSGFTVGAGLGFCLQMSVLYLQSLVKEGKETSEISCMANFSQSIGGGLCLAVLSAIFNGKFTQDFKKLPLKLQLFTATARPADYMNATTLGMFNLTVTEGRQVVQVYEWTLQTVTMWTVPFAIIAFLVTLVLKEKWNERVAEDLEQPDIELEKK